MALSTTRTLLTQTGINTHQIFGVGGLDSVGVATFSNFKTGSTNVHSVGIEAAGINVLGGDTPIGTGATIFRDGGANFSGIVSATTFSGSFTGDGQNLTGLPAGLGTALSNTQTLALNKVYYTDRVLSISTTTTVDPPASASIAYTQYTDIKIEDGHDLIIKDGDELRPDVLGLSTTKTLDTNNFPDGLRGNLIGNVTGDITLADSITHDGDTNTKIRFPTNDTITFETAGSEKVRIDSDGRLLIGTTTAGISAGDDLTIANDHAGMTFRVGSTTQVSHIYFSDGTSGTSEYAGYLQYNHNTDAMKFGTGSVERMVIDSSGNLSVTGTVTDSKGELRNFPQVSVSSNRVLTSSDAGKHVINTGSGGWTINTSSGFSVGDVVRIINASDSSQVLYQAGGVTIYSRRDGGVSGDHSIVDRGAAIIICTGSNQYYVSGDI